MATIHDNYLQLSLTGIKIKSFDVTDHAISDGQPYEGITVSGDDKLDIRAGRKGSDTVATWFKEKAKTGVVIGCETSDSYPSELNFAIYGTLTFESSGKTWVVKNMLFAQGYSALKRNNWWVGGPYMEGGSVKPLVGAIVSSASVDGLPLGKVGFIAPPACVSHFDLVTVAL